MSLVVVAAAVVRYYRFRCLYYYYHTTKTLNEYEVAICCKKYIVIARDTVAIRL
jgi:hypothetical protein